MTERASPSESQISRRGFFKRLLGSEKIAVPADNELSTEPVKVAKINRREFVKGALAVTGIVASGVLEGCGQLVDSTPEGDWYDEAREAFPEHLITLAPEIEKTLSPEGKANILNIIARQFEHVPKVFWSEIKGVTIEPMVDFKKPIQITVDQDKIVRLEFEIVPSSSPIESTSGTEDTVDGKLLIQQDKIVYTIVEQLGYNWYSHLSDTATALIESLSPDGANPKKSFAHGFGLHLLYPDTIPFMQAYAKKYGLEAAIKESVSAYEELRTNVFGGHDFDAPNYLYHARFVKSTVANTLVGYKHSNKNWLAFIEPMRDLVSGTALDFVDCATAEAKGVLWHFEGNNSDDWKSFDEFMVSALQRVEKSGNKCALSALKSTEIYYRGLWAYRNGAPDKFKENLEQAKQFIEGDASQEEKFSLASDGFEQVSAFARKGHVDPKDICFWYQKQKEFTVGSSLYEAHEELESLCG